METILHQGCFQKTLGFGCIVLIQGLTMDSLQLKTLFYFPCFVGKVYDPQIQALPDLLLLLPKNIYLV